MSEWETIQDKSSHISPVKFTLQRNYSTDRVEDLFEAIYKTPRLQRSPEKQTPASYFENISRKKQYIKKTLKAGLVMLLLSFILMSWYCKDTNNNSYCTHTRSFQHVSFEKAAHLKETLITTKELFRLEKDRFQKMAIETNRLGFEWFNQQHQILKECYNKYIYSSLIWTRDYMNSEYIKYKQQLDDYIQSGRPTPSSTLPEEKSKKLKMRAKAKNILDYFNGPHRPGMRQQEAREKAKEILYSFLVDKKKTGFETTMIDKDTDRLSFEVQSIIAIGREEKSKLDDQLDTIQSNIKQDVFSQQDSAQEFLLFTNAFKIEIDNLRMNAEKKVRDRTKQAVQSLSNSDPVIQKNIDQRLLLAQNAALEDLRRIYIKLHETEKMIDELQEV